jgi:F0F1-type ATP synthase membrane subunit b/b'
MKKTAQEGGRAEMAKLEETGRRETDRILSLAATEINLRIESALKQLREKIADQTIEHFKNDIQRNLDPDIQKKIIDRNIDQIGELDEGK